LSLVVDRAPANLREIYQISRRHGLSAYDATYLELAMRLKLPLATRDTTLKKASHTLDLYLA
jgi:predicted nucleic acid-binding protein